MGFLAITTGGRVLYYILVVCFLLSVVIPLADAPTFYIPCYAATKLIVSWIPLAITPPYGCMDVTTVNVIGKGSPASGKIRQWWANCDHQNIQVPLTY